MLSFYKPNDKKKKVKKTKEQRLLERAKNELEASHMIGVPVRFGMGAADIKRIKQAVKGK